jgi:hypothetical protein
MPTGQKNLSQSSYWRLFYGIQLPFNLLAIYLHTFVYVEEPINFCVKGGRKDEALHLISKVYKQESM